MTLAGALTPGSITVNNTVQNYSFTGAGGVLGAPLTKQGAGSLSFNNVGDNSFGGPVTIEAGAVIFANNGLNTFASGLAVNGGSVALGGNNTNVISSGALSIAFDASLTVSNANANDFGSGLFDLDGTFTIDESVDSTLSGVLSGGGTLIKSGSGTLTLAADNSALSTVIRINGGTVKVSALNALGVTGVTIASGGAVKQRPKPRYTSGNRGRRRSRRRRRTGQYGRASTQCFGQRDVDWRHYLRRVRPVDHTDPVLNRGRWDIRNSSLNAAAQAFSLTKVGSNQVTLAGSAVDAALGDINVQQGALGFEGATTSMGDPTKTLTVSAGATVIFFDTTTE